MTSTIDDDDLAMSMSGIRRNSRDSWQEPGPSGTPQPGTAAAARVPPQVQNAQQATPKAAVRMGAYTVIRTLGEGSFGKVKLATHGVSGQQVALKIISRRKLVTRDMTGRIEREIQFLQLLRHPHIIKLYTVITTPQDIIMVLEYAGGELFDYIVANGKMPEDKARRFFQQIVAAVEYCHRHGIVHRDLKPENLLLDENLNVKIADFGLSNIMTDGNFLKTSCGSPNYAAPEVIGGRLYAGPEVDVWSTGVILYVLLVGRLPFDDEYIPSLFKKIQTGQYAIPNYLSQAAVSLIKRMLAVNPLQRITFQEIRQDPWFTKDLAYYLQMPSEDFVNTGVDPNKAIDPRSMAKGKPVAVQEKLHSSVVNKLGKTMGYGAGDVEEALSKDEPSTIKDAYVIVRENQLMKENPLLAQEQPQFMAQSPPPFHANQAMTPRAMVTRPAPSPLSKINHPRQGSSGSASFIESRSPASTVAILPSSLPDYHAAYMKGHKSTPTSPTTHDDTPGRPRTKEEQEAVARRLKPHSRSSTNLARIAETTPAALTPVAEGGSGSGSGSGSGTRAKKARATRWQFGIRSRNSPAEAIVAIYRGLHKMGAQWEVPRAKEPGSSFSTVADGERADDEPQPRGHHESADENSPEYSDSDPGSGTDPEYATAAEQARRRAQRGTTEADARGRRPRERDGKWNDWGYTVPEDPWVINARFKKEGMRPAGAPGPVSAKNSAVDLGALTSGTLAMTTSANLEGGEDGEGGKLEAGGGGGGKMPPVLDEEAVWVYVNIQLYSIDADFYLVDFKCDGYERLVRRFADTVGGGGVTAREEHGRGGGEGGGEGEDLDPGYASDGELTADGVRLMGAGRNDSGEKEITSPFPFLDVASRLIVGLAEGAGGG